MKILIFGQNSYLFNRFKYNTKLNAEIVSISYKDIHDKIYGWEPYVIKHILNSELEKIGIDKYDVIINFVGATGTSNIDDLVVDEATKKNAYFINSEWPRLLKNHIDILAPSAHFIHFSSGCIFNGYEKEWDYTDYNSLINDQDYLYSKCPSFYSLTKLNAEINLSHTKLNNMSIIRIRMPYSEFPHKKNYITKILSYSNVLSLKNSMTYIPYLIRCMDYIIQSKVCGIFNVVNSINCAEDFLKIINPEYIEKYNIYSSYSEFKKSTPIKDNRSNCILLNNLTDFPVDLNITKDGIYSSNALSWGLKYTNKSSQYEHIKAVCNNYNIYICRSLERYKVYGEKITSKYLYNFNEVFAKNTVYEMGSRDPSYIYYHTRENL
jgi:dTDP-4-dehydrorhamnose reductase